MTSPVAGTDRRGLHPLKMSAAFAVAAQPRGGRPREMTARLPYAPGHVIL